MGPVNLRIKVVIHSFLLCSVLNFNRFFQFTCLFLLNLTEPYNDIEISPKKFKLKVRFPKTVFRHKEAIDKDDIIKILNGCSDLRLKTYVMLLASTGLRATEALSIRLKDLDIITTSSANNDPARLRIRGEYTKTKVDRYVFLTKEVVEQIKIWVDYKYRKRRICHIDKETGKKWITEYRTPEKKPNDLIFSLYQTAKPSPDILYGIPLIINTLTINFKNMEKNIHSLSEYIC